MAIKEAYVLDQLKNALVFAKRSPFPKFRTGAILAQPRSWSGTSEVGWSHPSELRLANYMSIHAEVHALLRASGGDNYTACFVSTLSSKDNVTSGKPCRRCTVLLKDAGIEKVFFTLPGFLEEGNYGMMDLLKIDDDYLRTLKLYKTRQEVKDEEGVV